MLSRLVRVAPAVVLLSCGSTKSEVPVVTEPRPTEAVVDDSPDLSPVEAPRDVVIKVRVRRPSRVVDIGTKWAGFPLDWRAFLARERPGLEAVLLPDAPADVVVALEPSSTMEPDALFAFSVAAQSVDGAVSFLKEEGETVDRLPRGLHRVRIGEDLVCIIGPALGDAPARVVCSDREEAVTVLQPYLARGMPHEDLGPADLHAHFLAEPLKRRFGAQLKLLKTAGVPFLLREIALDHPHFDRALKDSLYSAADELLDIIEDLDRIAIDVSLDDENRFAEAALTLKMMGLASGTAQALAEASERMTPAPESFWKLPRESVSANYTVRSHPPRVERFAKPVSELADGILDYLGLEPARRGTLVGALNDALLVTGPMAHAELPIASDAFGDASKKEGADLARAMVGRAIGYHLWAVDADAGRYAALLDALAAALGDKRFRRALSERPLLADVDLPTLRKRAPRGVRGLPRGTQVYEFSVPGSYFELSVDEDDKKKARPSKPFPIFLAVLPQTDRTWIGVSADERGILGHLKDVVADSPGDRLDAREGLGALRSEKAAAAGFTTLAALVASAGASVFDSLDRPDRASKRDSKLGGALAVMPHSGATPMVYRGVASADGPLMRISIRVPVAVIEDAAAGLAAATGEAMLP